MYKPPENTNRVKAIKSKFENNDNLCKNNEQSQSVRNNIGVNQVSLSKNNNQHSNLSNKDDKQFLKKQELFNNSNSKKEELFNNSYKQELLKGKENNRKQELLNNSENRKLNQNDAKTVKQHVLSRQLSDPVKVNIKRTPAFRNDKQFQRNGGQISCRVKGTEDKSQCDKKCASPQKSLTSNTSFGNLRKRFDSQEDLSILPQHALRARSNTSAEIILSKHKMCNKVNNDEQCLSNLESKVQKIYPKVKEDVRYENISFLYSEPVPKALRRKECDANDVHNVSTLKISDKVNLQNVSPENVNRLKSMQSAKNAYNNTLKEQLNNSSCQKSPLKKQVNSNSCQNEVNSSSSKLTLQKVNSNNLKKTQVNLNGSKKSPSEKRVNSNGSQKELNTSSSGKFTGIDDDLNFKLNALTDTLKLALKKPLPAGPAPKKPPRTFAHTSPNLQTKSDFEKRLNQALAKSPDRKAKRTDPKYMLDKLENALKNNRIRLKRTPKIDYTSEEDNSNSETEKKPAASNSRMNLNCLQSLSCSNATYERIGEPKSEFYADEKMEEPVYAEPFVFPHNVKESDAKLNRNSLYYMSTPVSATNDASYPEAMDENGLNHSDIGDETSSLSTPSTSDIDSVASTPSDENKKFMSSKIKELMKAFEPMPTIENRVDKLGSQLRHTLDSSFLPTEEKSPPPSAPSSTEGESKDACAGKYETYVKKIRIIANMRKKCDSSHLFYSCLLVGLDGKEPYIKFKFPQNVDLPAQVEHLCFPDAIDSSIDYSVKAQNYSIVLTDHLGKRIYGYCRRVLPEDSQKCLPLAYCILSKQRAGRFYRRILEELESRHGMSDKVRDIFLNKLYYHQFPSPGQSVRFDLAEVNQHLTSVISLGDKTDNSLQSNGNRISNGSDVDVTSFVVVDDTGTYGTLRKSSDVDGYNKRNGVFFKNGLAPQVLIDNNELTSISTPTEFVITLHQDSRYKENDLEELCNTLKSDILQKVFASLLLERKVIFISSLLGKLSTCIEAVQNMLYPFQWPHTLISVVPKDLLELVEAPTPLICGALSLNTEDYDIEHGIVVNLDKGKILKEVGDEDKIIPGCLLKEFKEGMSLAYKSSKENECAFNILLSDAFIRIFINSCGHYTLFIKDNQFQKEEFIQHVKSKSLRRFLTWFTETTMFCSFIETVMVNPSSFSVFDERIQIYSSPDVNLILGKMKDWKKGKSNTLFF